MAEKVKAKQKKELNLYKDEQVEKKDIKKEKINNKKLQEEKEPKEEKKSLWYKFMNFCHGVKSEAKKVRWTSKEDMLKYSIATIVFIIFCSIFFYGIDTVFALIQSLFQ